MDYVNLSQNFSFSNNSEDFLLYNPYIEEVVLMGIISNSALADYYFSEIKEELFYLAENKIIFQQMQQIYLQNKVITPINLIYQLEDLNLIKKIGGHQKIIKLSQLTFAMSYHILKSYIAILKDKLVKRQLSEISKFFHKIAYTYKSHTQLDLNSLQLQIAKITQNEQSKSLLQARDLLEPALNRLRDSDNNISKVLTGIKNLDNAIEGLERGNLIIIAGRPSMGKTAFSLSLALNVGRDKPSSCSILFSLEMTSNQIINRLMAIDSNLSLAQLRSLEAYNLTGEKLHELFSSIYKSHLYINDNEVTSINKINLLMKTVQAKHNQIDLVIIDYLQLLGDSKDNRAQELGYITRNLKNLAKVFNVPILVLSQLNRNVEQRSNKRPILADLRESGCLDSKTAIAILNKDDYIDKCLKSLVLENFFLLYSIHTTTRQFKRTYAHQVKCTGNKHLYQIEIHNYSQLLISANHKVLTLQGWKRLDQLIEQDFIATIHQNQIKNQNLNISDLDLIEFQKVTKIFYSKKDIALDIQIPPFANFIANQIIVHNSIEQDADIVLLLYRQNYYRMLNNIPEDLTEVIVAKNRNGKTGTVSLKFLPEIAKFE